MPAGRPLKFKTVKELQAKIDDYFESCWVDVPERIDSDGLSHSAYRYQEKPYTITGLALFLDTSRETLTQYEERPEFVDAIKRAKLKCENWVEENHLMGKINPTAGIFNLKNNYGWKDKTETDLTSGGKPIPILANALSSDDSNKEGSESKEQD